MGTFTNNPDYFAGGGYITDESLGHAFNLRFGVELNGVRYCQKLRLEDPDSGNGEHPPNSRVVAGPHTSAVALGITGDPDPGRGYSARYENDRTQTWETRNPADRSGRLDIPRVRVNDSEGGDSWLGCARAY